MREGTRQSGLADVGSIVPLSFVVQIPRDPLSWRTKGNQVNDLGQSLQRVMGIQDVRSYKKIMNRCLVLLEVLPELDKISRASEFSGSKLVALLILFLV